MQSEVQCEMGEWGKIEARKVSRVEVTKGFTDQEMLPKACKEFGPFLVAMESHRNASSNGVTKLEVLFCFIF